MKQFILLILAGLTTFILVSFLSDVSSLAQNTSPQPTQLISSLLNLSSNGDSKLVLEADLENVDELANPEIQLKQDGGKVSSTLGYQEGENHLQLINNRGKAKLLFRENGSICLGVDC